MVDWMGKPKNKLGPFCFTSTEARWLIRDGDRGERGRKSEFRLDCGYRPKKTGETVDRRQNHGVPSPFPSDLCTTQLLFQLQSHNDNVRCTAVEEKLEAKEVQLS